MLMLRFAAGRSGRTKGMSPSFAARHFHLFERGKVEADTVHDADDADDLVDAFLAAFQLAGEPDTVLAEPSDLGPGATGLLAPRVSGMSQFP